ncbi:hypothetical protein GCM10029963_14010 [Micromonospora andamanensis]
MARPRRRWGRRGRVYPGFGSLDGSPQCPPGGQVQLGGGGRGDVGRHGDGATELHPQVVAVALNSGDGGRPGVAGAAVGTTGMQCHGRRRERDEDVTGVLVTGDEVESVGEQDPVTVGMTSVEVETD